MAHRRHHGRRRTYRAKEPAVFNLVGGIAFTGGLTMGYLGAELIHRFAVTYAGTTTGVNQPSSGVTTIAQYNSYATEAKPSMASLGLQGLLAIAGIFGGIYAPWNAVKLLSYGIGFGATAHAVGQIATHWMLMPIFANSVNGPRLFANETAADNAVRPATPMTSPAVMPATAATPTPAPSGSGAGMQGDPPQLVSRRGTPVAAAAPQMAGRVPHALASMMGAAVAQPNGVNTMRVAQQAVPAKGAAPVNQAPVSVLQSTGGGSVGGGGGASTGAGGGTSMVGGGGGLTANAPPASTPPAAAPPSNQHKVGCSCTNCGTGSAAAVAHHLGEVPQSDVHPMMARRYSRPTPYSTLRRVA